MEESGRKKPTVLVSQKKFYWDVEKSIWEIRDTNVQPSPLIDKLKALSVKRIRILAVRSQVASSRLRTF